MIEPSDPAQRLLSAVRSRVAVLNLDPRFYTFEVEDIRNAFPKSVLGGDNDVVSLEEILVWDERHRGLGSRLMSILTSQADLDGVTIVLNACVFGPWREGGLDQEQLESWYARLGFVRWYGVFLIRHPRQT